MIDVRRELPLAAIPAGMLAWAAAAWPSSPDRFPMHWNAAGAIDRWGGRAEGLFLLPVLALGLWGLMKVLPRVDPGRANYASFGGAYLALRYASMLLLLGVYVSVQLAARGVALDMSRVAGGLVGTLFLVMGATLGKIRPNWFVGVRTPWTLSSKTSWVRTHRLAGWMFAVAGAAILGAAVLAPAAVPRVVMVGALGTAAISTVYSYVVWRRDPERIPPANTQPAS